MKKKKVMDEESIISTGEAALSCRYDACMHAAVEYRHS
jgi:hypothetical protein